MITVVLQGWGLDTQTHEGTNAICGVYTIKIHVIFIQKTNKESNFRVARIPTISIKIHQMYTWFNKQFVQNEHFLASNNNMCDWGWKIPFLKLSTNTGK
jgi:hypothetical protein